MFAKSLIHGTVLIGLVAGRAGAQYHHASTEYEGALRGEADFLRSVGEANYWASLANRQNAEAIREWRIAERDRLLSRWQSKADAQLWRASKLSRLTNEQANDIARKTARQPLADGQLDRSTGELQWPKVLRQDRYARFTTRLDVLMAKRVTGADTDTIRLDVEIEKLSRELLDAVKLDVHRFRSSREFTVARKFAEGLVREFEATSV